MDLPMGIKSRGGAWTGDVSAEDWNLAVQVFLFSTLLCFLLLLGVLVLVVLLAARSSSRARASR